MKKISKLKYRKLQYTIFKKNPQIFELVNPCRIGCKESNRIRLSHVLISIEDYRCMPEFHSNLRDDIIDNYWDLTHDCLDWHYANKSVTITFLYNLFYKK